MSRLSGLLAACLSVLVVQPASAAIIWADLESFGANHVSGTVGGVSVTYTGDLDPAPQVDGTGTQYWSPFPSPDGPAAGPDPLDIIFTTAPGLKTITFGQTVTDVYLAVNSWNEQVATFSRPFTVIANGVGYWGSGTPIVSNGGTTLSGQGELHAILKFAGSIDSLSFTDTVQEQWHGLQIGVGSVAAVPELATWTMMILALGVTGGILRRRRPSVPIFSV